MKRRRVLYSMILLFVLAASCAGTALYQDLSEDDANEMLVLLNKDGIKASKKKEVRQNEIYWSVVVGSKDMSRARELLMQHNLPRHRELGLTGVYKEKGLIPTPDEQKARYLLAIKGEIINSLERLPDVVDADVVLNVPSKDEFSSAEEKAKQRPTASIIVKMNPPLTGEPVLTEAKLQQFVANAVEGMNPRDVAVVMSYISEQSMMIKPGQTVTIPSVASLSQGQDTLKVGEKIQEELVGLRLDAPSKGRLKIYLLSFFLLLIFLSGGLIISVVQASRLRRRLSSFENQAGSKPMIEGKIIEEEPPRLGT